MHSVTPETKAENAHEAADLQFLAGPYTGWSANVEWMPDNFGHLESEPEYKSDKWQP